MSRTGPNFGICVLTWNSGESLANCIGRLREIYEQMSCEIVIVDNCSDDNSIQNLESSSHRVSILVNEANLGFARGNNIGARWLIERGCEFLIFANPDVSLSCDLVRELIAALSVDPRTGCAGGVAQSPRGETSIAVRTRPSFLEKLVFYGPLHRIRFLRRLCHEHFVDLSSLCNFAEVYAVSGALLAVRSEAFQQCGGFDPKTFLYEEELIFAERLMRRQWKTRIAKHAYYNHDEGASTSQIPYRRRLCFIASEQYLMAEYYGYGFIARAVLLGIRYVEWSLYCLRWVLTKAGSRRPSAIASESSESVPPSLRGLS